MTLARELAEDRGEILSPLEEYRGRSMGEIFAATVLQAKAADAADATRIQREGTGPPAPVHVMFDEPVIHSAQRSGYKLAIFNRARHFADQLAAQRRLQHAELAANWRPSGHSMTGASSTTWPGRRPRAVTRWRGSGSRERRGPTGPARPGRASGP